MKTFFNTLLQYSSSIIRYGVCGFLFLLHEKQNIKIQSCFLCFDVFGLLFSEDGIFLFTGIGVLK